MIARFSRLRRAIVVPAAIVTSLALLAGGVVLASTNGNLVEPTDGDRQAANATFAPATGLDVVAPLPQAGEVGGAGAIEPSDRPTALVPSVSGVVDAVLVREGDQVSAGQPLLRLRSETERAELAAAEAEVRAAAGEVAALRAEATAAEARAAQSAGTAERTLALAARNAATPDERDRAERSQDADAAAAAAARARAEQAAGRLGAARARVELAAARLDRLELRAPADAEVLQVLVRPGEAASPNTTAIVTGDTARLRARIDINERDAAALAVGQKARVRVEGSEQDLTGSVVEIARRVGRKNVRTEDPTDRQDARFVETLIELDTAPRVPIGIRVQGFVAVP